MSIVQAICSQFLVQFAVQFALVLILWELTKEWLGPYNWYMFGMGCVFVVYDVYQKTRGRPAREQRE